MVHPGLYACLIGIFSMMLSACGKRPQAEVVFFGHLSTGEEARLYRLVNRRGASLDLTEIYAEDLDSCSREVWKQGDALHVVDIIQAGDSTCTVRWAMCTGAESVEVQEDGISVSFRSGRHERVLSAVVDGLPAPVARTWPVTYDPSSPDAEGMEHLHPTDAPNPGVHLVGYTFTLQPHQKAALHVCLEKII